MRTLYKICFWGFCFSLCLLFVPEKYCRETSSLTTSTSEYPVKNNTTKLSLSPSLEERFVRSLRTYTFLPEEDKREKLLLGAAPLQFDRNQWERLVRDKGVLPPGSLRETEGMHFDLPYDSKLSISGRKRINVKFGKTVFKHPNETTIKGTPAGAVNDVGMEQELQVKIKGKVGPKISVDIDYDDTKEDKRDISVVYKGDPEEVVQEAAFGDIDLSLPQTEFVAYNKKLFGGKIDTQPVKTTNHRLRLLGIGSRTKGVTETKRFKGNTTFDKRDIQDTQYVRWKYYKIFPSGRDGDLPIQAGSEEIYIDNKNAADNKNSTKQWNQEQIDPINGKPVIGDFDVQYPGVDYTIDYRTGIITFTKPVGQNHVIVVDYRKADGAMLSSDTGRKKVIKDELNTPLITRELKNHYSLGSTKIVNDPNKFILKVLDRSRNEVLIPAWEIDYDFGIIRFRDELPFARSGSDIYTHPTVSPNNYYTISVEFYHSVKTYNLRPGIVPRSESIRVNGERLNRDEDYFIDYEIGLLTFLKDLVITNETEIEVSYEYMPFGGLFQQTIVGARTEYEYADRLLLGSTVLYNWATPSGNVPDVRSTPESILVLEADSKLHLEPQRLWKINLDGLEIDIGGEVARSKFNPNIFGKAMVDNMDGSELADGVSTDKNLWSLGSLPLSATLRGTLELSNDNDVKVKDINTNSSDTGNTQVADLNYVFNSTTTWVSLVQPLSKTGIDYSKHLFLQVWIHGEGKGEKLHIDLGRVSEDADGQGGFATDQFTEDGRLVWRKGSPKTEDKNNNGVLDVGEDVGWEFLHPTQGSIRIGAGNGRLDTEDLDGDGILSTSESIPTALSTVTDYPVTISWTGWRRIIVPLNINDANITIWQAVKHARVWVEKGSAEVGTIRVAQMEILGNRWDKPVIASSATGNLEIRVQSEEDNSNVILKNYSDYVSLYKDTVNKDMDKNKVISLIYTNLSGEAYTRRQFSKSQDYSKHGALKFFVHGDGKGERFFLRIGADDNNYYEYAQDITWIGWNTVSVNLPDGFTNKVGFPTLVNISVLKLGIIGNGGSGEIWIDEIHLTEPKVEIGQAQKFSVGTRYTDWGTVNAVYRDVDDTFSMVGVPRVNQSVVSRSISSSFTKLKILPVNFSWDKTKTVTPSTFRTDLSSLMEGVVVGDNLSVGTVLSKQDLPRVGLSFKRNNSDSNLQQKINKVYTYGIDVSYYSKLQLGLEKPGTELSPQGAIPLGKVPAGQSPLIQIPKEKKRWFGFFSFLVPDSLSSYYNRIHGYTFYGLGLKKNPGFEDLFEETDDWMVTPAYQWQMAAKNVVNRLSLTPSYKRRKTAETKEFYNSSGESTYAFKRKKSDTQTAGLSGQLDLLQWLNPTFRYTINTYEVYNVDASSKNVNRNATTEFTYLLRMRDVWRWKHLESLSFNNRYKVDEGDIYESVVGGYRTMDKLLLRQPFDSGVLKSTNRQITYEHTTRWSPLKYFMLAEPWAPLRTIDITSKYTKINEHRVTTGTPYDSYTKIWPDLVVIIAELEKFIGPLQKKRVFLEQSQVTLKYYLRQIDRTNISYTREDFWSISWVGRLFKKYTLLFNTENTRGKDYNTEGVITRNAKSTLNSGQVNFSVTGGYRFILRYEDRKQTDFDRFNAKSETTTKTPSAEMKKDLEFPHGLRIPFFKKIWYLKNTVQLSTLLKTIIQRSTVADKNNNTYSGSLGIDYNLSSNFALSLGIQGSKVKNIDQEINDYYTYGGNVTLLIRF